MGILKRVIIKEELVELTGDYKKAILLNQLIYWSERVKDFDKFITEEIERSKKDEKQRPIQPLLNGWIYKTADKLSEETMMNIHKSNMRNQIKNIVEQGYLKERTNPKNKIDKTMQYRVNIKYIQEELLKLGYNLDRYPIMDKLTFENKKDKVRPLRRAVIKEELVKLTGDYKKAIILNQLIYWSERINDFDKYIEEENSAELKLRHGWINKKEEEIAEETMMNLHKTNIKIHTKYLREKGWIEERCVIVNAEKRKQYRVNIKRIQKDLQKLGYGLEGYPIDTEYIQKERNIKKEEENIKKIKSETQQRKIEQETAETEKIYKQIDQLGYDQSTKNLIKSSIQEIENAKREINNHDAEKRKENINKLTPAIIESALRKFKKIDKNKIKNPYRYFTTMLYTEIFEYKAIQTAGKQINKFHNFDQSLIYMTEEEIEDITTKKFKERVDQITKRKTETIQECKNKI